MYRGTTPTFQITMSLDCNLLTALNICFKQGETIIAEKGLEDVEISGNVLKCGLSEEETLKLDEDGDVMRFQVRCGIGSARYATKIFRVRVEEILKDGAL